MVNKQPGALAGSTTPCSAAGGDGGLASNGAGDAADKGDTDVAVRGDESGGGLRFSAAGPTTTPVTTKPPAPRVGEGVPAGAVTSCPASAVGGGAIPGLVPANCVATGATGELLASTAAAGEGEAGFGEADRDEAGVDAAGFDDAGTAVVGVDIAGDGEPVGELAGVV